jgi:hypothetical protein
MSRTDRQAENQLERKLQDLRTILNGLRADQTFGSSDVRMYRVYNRTSSFDTTITNVTTTTSRCIEFTLTHQSAASNPVIAYDFAIQVSTDVPGDLFYRYDSLPPTGSVQKFRVYLLSNSVTFAYVNVGVMFWTISDATYTFAEVTP